VHVLNGWMLSTTTDVADSGVCMWPRLVAGTHVLDGGSRLASSCEYYWMFGSNAILSYQLIWHTYPFNGPFSGTTRVSRYQKGKPIWILLKQETVSGSGISWAICKPAPRSRQITMPAPHHSVFYRPDALPAAQPTASKHWINVAINWKNK